MGRESELTRIELADPVTFPLWEDDPFTFRPLYNPDGTRKRARLKIDDEIMEIHDSGPGWVFVKRGMV